MSEKQKSSFIKRIYVGRLNRLNYVKGSLFAILPFVILFLLYWVLEIVKVIFSAQVVDENGAVISNSSSSGGIFPMLITLLGLACFCYYAVVAPSLVVRRHHDFNQSWIYPVAILAVLSILTLINGMLASLFGLIYVILLVFLRGSIIKNRYGDPDQNRNILQIVGIKI